MRRADRWKTSMVGSPQASTPRRLTSAAGGVIVALGGGRSTWWRRRRVWSSYAVPYYVAAPDHFSSQKLQDVWLSED